MKYTFAIFIFCVESALAQDACNNKNTAFKQGEDITYKIYYQWSKAWVNAGEVNFKVSLEELNKKPVYHITGDGKTYPEYDWFYKVRDRYETFIDTAQLVPLRFIRNVREGNTAFCEYVNFNREKNKAYSAKKTTNITTCTQDVLSAIYFCRNMDLKEFENKLTLPISLYLDNEVYKINIKYLGEENITVGLGTYNCVKFKVKMIAGTIFKEDNETIVWVSNDKNRLPIHIESELIVGTVKVDLIKYKGLKTNLIKVIK